MPLVLDASVLLAWLLEDESSTLAEAAIAEALTDGAVAPAILPFEFANGVRSAVRSQRLGQDEISGAQSRMNSLEIQQVEFSARELVIDVNALALAHGLTTYDASYLYLALREDLPLATVDRRLQAAAAAVDCRIFA